MILKILIIIKKIKRKKLILSSKHNIVNFEFNF